MDIQLSYFGPINTTLCATITSFFETLKVALGIYGLEGDAAAPLPSDVHCIRLGLGGIVRKADNRLKPHLSLKFSHASRVSFPSLPPLIGRECLYCQTPRIQSDFLVSTYLAHTCPQCQGYLGVVVTELKSRPREATIKATCSRCGFKLAWEV